jgi:ankyrin repeat protein
MALFIAIKRNKLDLVQQLRFRDDINARNGNGFTPLNWALSLDRLDIVSYLLTQKIDINIPNNQGWTPLHYAVSHKLIPFVERLLKLNANINVYNDDHRSPLYYAMMTHQYDVMTRLLKHSVESEPIPTLYDAIIANDTVAINLLLKYNIDVNRPHIYNGQTVLHAAVECNRFVDEVLSRTTNPNIQDKDGDTPLHLGIHSNTITNKLLLFGANPHLQNNHGNTILHLAVNTSDIDTINTILSYGVDVNARNNDDETCVCNTDSITIIDLLCRHKADLNAWIHKGKSTPFHSLWPYVTDELVAIYLKYHANPNIQDDDGQTVLHYATNYGQTAIVKLLLEAGADFELRNLQGVTAKALALKRQRHDIIKLFEYEELKFPMKEPSDY